jgi:beta-galactosidase/beta-glucuronidase
VARLGLSIPNAKRWSPDAPHLYDLRVRLIQDDKTFDEVESYFGLREIELREGKMWLNGEPIYLKMVLDQGYWPESGMTAPTDEALRADVEWCKKFGFNGARKHQKVEDPRYLYWCDKLGLLVWGEMANARAWNPQAEEWFVAEWERVVRRDVNHPCIITWVPLNETWGLPGLRDAEHPAQYAFAERLVALTRRLDPERPVVDNDGWQHTDVTDILAIHDYAKSGKALRKRYAKKLAGGALPKNAGDSGYPIFVRGSQYHGQPIMLTEVGGFLMHPPGLPKEKWDELYSAYGTHATAEELWAKYEDLMHGLADLHFVSGWCYTQLTDIEQEMNGLLTPDRQPKIEPEKFAALHRELFPA